MLIPPYSPLQGFHRLSKLIDCMVEAGLGYIGTKPKEGGTGFFVVDYQGNHYVRAYDKSMSKPPQKYILVQRPRTLEEYARGILKNIIDIDSKIDPITIVIGCGRGGLLARFVTARLDNVEKLILVGTPNLGMNESKFGFWDRFFMKSLRRKTGYKAVLPNVPDSEFLDRLNRAPPLKAKIFTLAGGKDEIVPPGSALGIPAIPAEQKTIFPSLYNGQLIPLPDSEEVGAIDKIIEICKHH